MSSNHTTDVPTVSTREAVREKSQLLQAKQKRARVLIRTVGILLALAVLAAGAYGVYLAVGSQESSIDRTPTGMHDDGVVVSSMSLAQPSIGAEAVDQTPEPEEAEGSSDDESKEAVEPSTEAVAGDEAQELRLGEQEAPGIVNMHIYVDYLSPGAGAFQRANAAQISGWIAEGAVSVTYHPVALLTASSNGSKYSLRAAGAAACVATHSPAQFPTYNHELLVTQPGVDSEGYSDVELADLAVAVGVDNSKVVRRCIEERHFMTWAKDATARALEGPLPGTDGLVLAAAPMVIVNGQTYIGAQDSPAELSQFVLTVASDAYYSQVDATPTPEATESAEPEEKD